MMTRWFFLILLGVSVILSVIILPGYLSLKEGVEKKYIIEVKAEVETAMGKKFPLFVCEFVDRKAINMLSVGDSKLTGGYSDVYVDMSDFRGGTLALRCEWKKDDMRKNDIENVEQWVLWYGGRDVANATKFGGLNWFSVDITPDGAYLNLTSKNKTHELKAKTLEGAETKLYISEYRVSVNYTLNGSRYKLLKDLLDSYWRWGLCSGDSVIGNFTRMWFGAPIRELMLGTEDDMRDHTRDLMKDIFRGAAKKEDVERYSFNLLFYTLLDWLINTLAIALVISFFHWLYRRMM